MAIAKKTPAPEAEKKTEAQPVKKTEEKKLTMTPNKMCRDLLLERAHTDDQIAEKVLAVFPEAKFNKSYVSTTRIDLNKGYYKSIEENLEENPLTRLVEYEDKGVITIDAAKAFKAEKDEAEKKRKAEERAAKKTETDKVRTNKPITGGVQGTGEIENAPKKGAGKKPAPKKS